jgi:hypothetical protein
MNDKVKKEKHDVKPTGKEELKFIPIDREKTFPCKNCRKRLSCFIRPRDGYCMGLEEGEPWVMPCAFNNELEEVIDD